MCYISCSVTSDSLWPHGLYSPLGSSIHGILQGRILEWVAIPFFRGSSWPRDQTWVLAQLVKNLQQCRRPWFDSWVRKIPWRRDRLPTPVSLGFPRGSDGKVSNCNAGDLGLISWRREQLTTPVLWPGEFHGQRSLAGYSPWGCKELDTTEWLSLSFFPAGQADSLPCDPPGKPLCAVLDSHLSIPLGHYLCCHYLWYDKPISG